MRILTLGNSFAENAVAFLEDMADASGGYADIIVGRLNLGGCSLEKHYNLLKQCDMLPGVNPYMLKTSKAGPVPTTLREALSIAEWDYVTLQQVSSLSWQPGTYYPFIEELCTAIRKEAPCARLVIHQTWAYRCDAPYFKDAAITQDEMYNLLQMAYDEAARRLDCRIIPSGAAFQKARKLLGYAPDGCFDFNKAEYPSLPEQKGSLIKGYYWATGNTPSGKAELSMDYKHANEMGCYLAGAVWFEFFTGADIRRSSFIPPGITPDDMATLRIAAREAVAGYGGSF